MIDDYSISDVMNFRVGDPFPLSDRLKGLRRDMINTDFQTEDWRVFGVQQVLDTFGTHTTFFGGFLEKAIEIEIARWSLLIYGDLRATPVEIPLEKQGPRLTQMRERRGEFSCNPDIDLVLSLEARGLDMSESIDGWITRLSKY